MASSLFAWLFPDKKISLSTDMGLVVDLRHFTLSIMNYFQTAQTIWCAKRTCKHNSKHGCTQACHPDHRNRRTEHTLHNWGATRRQWHGTHLVLFPMQAFAEILERECKNDWNTRALLSPNKKSGKRMPSRATHMSCWNYLWPILSIIHWQWSLSLHKQRWHDMRSCTHPWPLCQQPLPNHAYWKKWKAIQDWNSLFSNKSPTSQIYGNWHG